jgi:hypothetical protein
VDTGAAADQDNARRSKRRRAYTLRAGRRPPPSGRSPRTASEGAVMITKECGNYRLSERWSLEAAAVVLLLAQMAINDV